MKRFVVFLVLVGLAVPGLAGTAWYQVENIDTTWYRVEPTEDTMKAESLKPPTVRSPLDSWIDGFSFGGVEMIEDTIRVWDCENTAALDSAQAWADSIDHHNFARQDSIVKVIFAEHDGHEIWISSTQNLVLYGPTCWACSVCGHFDVPTCWFPDRLEVRCGDRIWRIR